MNISEIDDMSVQDMDIYARLSEVQLLHYYEPDLGIFIAESPNVILRALEAGYEPISLLVQRDLVDKEAVPILDKIRERLGDDKAEHIRVYTAKLEVINKLTGYNMIRGILAAMRRKAYPTLDEFCKEKKKLAVLYDVENPTNVGAIVRSAAALGMDGVILSDGCADPFYRRAARVSMGTVFQIPLIKGYREESLLGRINELGYKTVAMALKDDSLDINDHRLKEAGKIAIILGTEGAGLPENVISECTYTVKIPMYHGVDSLNVAAASAVAFYELCQRT